MSSEYTIELDFKEYEHPFQIYIRSEIFKIKRVVFKFSFIDWKKGMISSVCDITFFGNLFDPQEKKIKWFLSNDLSKDFKSNFYSRIENTLTSFLKKEPSFIEEEKKVKDLNDKFDNQKYKYVLLKSKVIGDHEEVFIGTEWVERNSNRLGLDHFVDKYEYYFTPHYHVINLELKSNKPSVINQEGDTNTEGYDWIYPMPIKETLNIFQELDIRIIKGDTIYTRKLEPIRLKKNSKEYNKLINTPFKKHRIFHRFEEVFIPSFKKSFINDCVFNIV